MKSTLEEALEELLGVSCPYGTDVFPPTIAYGYSNGRLADRFASVALMDILSHGESPERFKEPNGKAQLALRSGEFDEVAVYQLVGTLKRVTKPGDNIPFAVGQVVKDTRGASHRILAVDRKSVDSDPFPIVTLIDLDFGRAECVFCFRADGTDYSKNKLIQNVGPESSAVEFVPVAPPEQPKYRGKTNAAAAESVNAKAA